MSTSPTLRAGRRVWLTTLAAAALAALVATALPAGAQPASDPAFEAASRSLQQASAGRTEAIGEAVERFAALLEQQPDDPLLRAYLGSATAMQATTTWLPWKKMSYAEDGLALIDKALAQLNRSHEGLQRRGVPVALETRFVAANTFLRLPSMFNRGERGHKLLAAVLADGQFAAAPAPFRATVWMRAARQAETDQQPEKAREWYTLIAASGAPQAAAAAARLKEL